MRRADARRGSALLLVLVLVGAVGLLVLTCGGDRARRLVELGRRQARIEARELALGARVLQPGTVQVGAWTVVRDAAGVAVSGPHGSLRLTCSPAGVVTDERWQRR